MRILLLSGTFLLAAAPMEAAAQSAPGAAPSAPRASGERTDMADMAVPTAALPFLTQAGASDLYEIESSQLALTKARSASVRAFAQQMIDDHRATTQKLAQAATGAGLVAPTPALLPDQVAMLARLRDAPAGGFDALYLDQQRTAHRRALALHRGYAARGDTPALQRVAAAAAPIVERHLQHVEKLAR